MSYCACQQYCMCCAGELVIMPFNLTAFYKVTATKTPCLIAQSPAH